MRQLRGVVAVLVVVVAGGLVVLGVEALSGRVYPLPPGADLSDPQALGAAITSMPAGAFALLLAGWALAAFLVGWIAARLTRVAWGAWTMWFSVIAPAVIPSLNLSNLSFRHRAG